MDGHNSTMHYANGDAYGGSWVQDKKWGHGTMSYANGDMYVGEWFYDRRHGQGEMHYVDGRIEKGTWYDGVFDEARSGRPKDRRGPTRTRRW